MKLKEKLIIYYLSATFVILFFVGLAALNAIKSLSINTLEQQLIDQSSMAELYISPAPPSKTIYRRVER